MTTELVKYVVEIKKVIRRTWVATENVVTKETPTEIMEDNYSNRRTAAIAKEYEVRDMQKSETVELSVYRQEAETLNLVGVISAVNSEAVA